MTVATLFALLGIGQIALAGAAVVRHREAQVVLAAVAAIIGLIVLIDALSN